MMTGLQFFSGKKVPLLLQAEASECGLACLAMVASHYGHHTTMNQARQRFGLSNQGVNLQQLISLSQRMGLQSRSLKLELNAMQHLKLPAVLHWDFNHFVVLVGLNAKQVIVHDPAKGRLKLSWQQLSKQFTGIALELWPTADFVPQRSAPSLSLRKLLGHLPGIKRSVTQILVLAFILEILLLLTPWLTQWVIDDVVLTGDKQLLIVIVIGFLLLIGFRAAAEGGHCGSGETQNADFSIKSET